MTERVGVHGRRGTLVLSTDHALSAAEMDDLSRQLRRFANRRPPVLVLDRGVRVEGVLPPPSRRARGGYRPRWAR